MIVRDDASTLEACLQSVRPHVDELVIVDTGSVDGSVAIEQRYADVWELYLGCNDPDTGLIVDFADARNRSYELATGDWVLWVDGDDVLVDGENLRRLCDAAPHEDNVFYVAPYEFQYNNEDGQVEVLIQRERLMRPRHAFIWQTPVHEGCLPRQPMAGGLISVETEAFKLCHHHINNGDPREPGRNLRIMKSWVEKCGEGDVRALYYLGLEYGLTGDVGNALHWLKRYCELSNWTDERCLAQLEISRLYRVIGDQREAIAWAFRAMATKSWPDPYYSIAKSCYNLACNGIEPHYNFARCAHFAQMGLNLARSGPASTLLQINPRERYAIHEYLNVALSRIGKLSEALASCEEGLSGLPKHADMLHNRRTYQVELARRHIREQADFLVGLEELRPEGAVIIKATLAGDFAIQLTQPEPHAHAGSCDPEEQPKADGCLDIILYTGPALERWNPNTWAETGMGGSETMAWHMARLLRARGHRVRVYADCTPTMQGVFQGVEWYDSSRFHNLRCDVLIVSRDPRAVDPERRVEAGCRLLWMHDVHCGEALTHRRDLRFDRILCLSDWHRTCFLSLYPLVDANRVVVTRNGIDLSLFSEDQRWVDCREEDSEEGDLVRREDSVPRNPHKAVYSSSPDRGLQTALDCWKDVRKAIPDAELHVYYGFDNWEKSARMLNDGPQQQSVRYLKQLAQSTPGVVVHGRIRQAELAREFLSAGVWAYPTWWTETSCLTAMEAQAAGLYMVTSPLAALNETVGDRGVLIEGDWSDPQYWRDPKFMKAWTEAVINAMPKVSKCESGSITIGGIAPREPLQTYAREHFGLEALADDWDKMLRALHAEVTERVVPVFTEIPERRAAQP